MAQEMIKLSNDESVGERPIQRPSLWLRILVLIPLLLLFFASYGLSRLLLHLALWLVWGPLGKTVLFVYSNSPTWQEHIEQNVLPRLPKRAVVLNWSERRLWSRLTLAYLVFRFLGGRREFNPLAVVVRPFRWARCFRFWQPFRDFKHGRPELLMKVEREFFECLGQDTGGRAI
jgi:hypothetical protein